MRRMTQSTHWHRAGAGCVWRGRHIVEMTAITMIATHANASQNVASEIAMAFPYMRGACQSGEGLA